MTLSQRPISFSNWIPSWSYLPYLFTQGAELLGKWRKKNPCLRTAGKSIILASSRLCNNQRLSTWQLIVWEKWWKNSRFLPYHKKCKYAVPYTQLWFYFDLPTVIRLVLYWTFLPQTQWVKHIRWRKNTLCPLFSIAEDLWSCFIL